MRRFAVVIAAVALAGCGGSSAHNAATTTTTRAASSRARFLEVRPVDAMGTEPCSAPYVSLGDGNCGRLGAVAVNGDDVATAQAGADPVTHDPTITVTLKSDAIGRFKAMAAAQVNKPAAILVDGKVVSAPTIQPDLATNFNGQFQIAGNFTAAEAQRMARALTP
jgi:preprotein translocase subunit SecD